MRMHLFTAFAALRIGIDILTQREHMIIDGILAHGGLFKTPMVGQKICAAALNVPVSVMATASGGGAWGMAVLAGFSIGKTHHESLSDYLSNKVFKGVEGQKLYPQPVDVNGFTLYLERYKEGLAIEQAAIDHLVENHKK
jgi:sugar (pentulose or hexulose) kinase